MAREISRDKFLRDLGLTVNQAKVYLALLDQGPAKVRAITKTAKISRPNVYVILERLQQLGIIEELVTKPISYRAVPLKDAVALLMEARTLEYEKAKAAVEIMHTLAQSKQEKPTKELEAEFILIPAGKTVINKIAAAINAADESIDFVVSWRRLVQGVTAVFAESLEEAARKKVKIRAIVERPLKSEFNNKVFFIIQQKTSCSIRFLPRPPSAVFGLYDKKEVFIITMPDADLRSSPALWSNNKPLITLVSEYFETLWEKASDQSVLS
ncbi:MAG: TrmB family transcriptional regulator [Candidatus Bathyarchaeia archaeon]